MVEMPDLDPKSDSFLSKFDYCFWAKLLVAIPVLPLVALIAAAQFNNMLLQAIAAIVAVGAVIYASKMLDKLFSSKMVNRK